MKIESSIPSPAARPQAQAHKATGSAGLTSGTATAASPRPLAQSAAPDSAAAPFDAQRVAEIKQAIADGRLQIDADKIAGRLIEGVRERLAKDKSAA